MIRLQYTNNNGFALADQIVDLVFTGSYEPYWFMMTMSDSCFLSLGNKLLELSSLKFFDRTKQNWFYSQALIDIAIRTYFIGLIGSNQDKGYSKSENFVWY